jgi:hypothetical protein
MTSPLYRLQADNAIVALNAATHLRSTFNGERQ